MGRQGSPTFEVFADQLLLVAESEATGLLVPMLNEHPHMEDVVKRVGIEDWDFFLTAGGVYSALSVLKDRVSEERFVELYQVPFDPKRLLTAEPVNAIRRCLDRRRARWFSYGEEAVQDCLRFVDDFQKTLADDERTLAAHSFAVGHWILFNLGDERSSEDGVIASKLGHCLTMPFLDLADHGA